MGAPTYSAPPLNPEINASSPFYPSLAGLVTFNRGDAMPRGVVHNAMPHGTAGYGSLSVGQEGVIVPNSFPFNPPADAAFANDYSYAVSGMMRSRQWLYEGMQPQSGINACTIFGIFNYQGGAYFTGGDTCVPLFGISRCNYADAGGVSTEPDGICLTMSGSTVLGNTLCLGYMTPVGVMYSTKHKVIPGHWYAVAATRSDQAGTGINGTFLLPKFLRFYLYDLTTGTQIGPNGVGVSQVFGSVFGASTDHIFSNAPLNQYYDSVGGRLIGGEITIPLTCNPNSGFGEVAGSFLIKMAGIDSQPWDDSGFAYAIPAAFSGVDQFTYWVSNIYEMMGSTYATGSMTGELFAPADFALTGDVYLYQGYGNASTNFAAIAGANSNTNYVFYGDAALTNVDNNKVQITCSRPQATPSVPTSLTYNLYRYSSYPIDYITGITNANPGVVTSGSHGYTNGEQITIYGVSGMTQVNNNTYTVAGVTGSTYQLSGIDTTGFGTFTGSGGVSIPVASIVATNTTGVFNYVPPTNGVYYYLIVANDGTNFYVYPVVSGSLNLLVDESWAFIGNSTLSKTGSLPSQWAHFANGLRKRIQIMDFGISSLESNEALPAYAPNITATFGGTATNGDTVPFVINNSGLAGGTVTLTINITTSETTTAMATALAAAINGNAGLTAQSITATSSGAVVTIASASTHPTTYSYSVTGTATETVVISTAIGVPPWSLSTSNYYAYFSSALIADVANRGVPYTVLGQMAGNDLGSLQSTYQGNLTTIQNGLLALTTTYLGPTTGSLTHGQTVPVVSRIIWLCSPWQRGGHSYALLSEIPTYQTYQKNVSNGTTVLALGSDAFNYGINFPDDVNGGHPSIIAARMQMMSLIKDLFMTSSGGSGGGGASAFS